MTIMRLLRRLLLALTPKTTAGDRFYAWISFVAAHHRLPQDRPYLNDRLYQLRTSGALRDPLRTTTSDKELVKEYIRLRVGDSHNVPTLAVFRSPDEISLAALPSDCCIKPTHASGHVVFRRNGERVDVDAIRAWFSLNYYAEKREPNYRGLTPKVIAEPILFGSSPSKITRSFAHAEYQR